MELLLALLAAVAVVVAAWVFTRLQDALGRERRLADELASFRRAPGVPVAPRGAADPSTTGIRAVSLPGDDLPAAAEPREDDAPSPEVPAPSPGPTAEELAALAAQVEAAAEVLSDLETILSEIVAPEERQAPGVPALPSAAAPPRTALTALEAALDEAAALIVSLGGERSRLKELLVSVEAAAGRLSVSARGGHSLVEQAERQSLAVAPAAASLSGLADRMNLLALNIALLATRAGEAGEAFTESGEELRGLFEEARALSREIGSAAQRAAGAARRAGEPLSDLVALADGTGGRASRAAAQVERLDELRGHLDETLAAARQAAGGIDAEERAGRKAEAQRAAVATEREARAHERAEGAEERLRSVPATLAGLAQARSSLGAVVRDLRRAAGPRLP